MLTNYGKIFAGSGVGSVCNRAERVHDSNDSHNRPADEKDLTMQYQDDKAVDPPKKRTPAQIEDEWADMGKSLKKLNNKNIRDYRLLEPGWAGELEDDQVAYIRAALHDDPDLAYEWGFKRSSKRFPTDIIRRIAKRGDANHRTVNMHLVKGQAS